MKIAILFFKEDTKLPEIQNYRKTLNSLIGQFIFFKLYIICLKCNI